MPTLNSLPLLKIVDGNLLTAKSPARSGLVRCLPDRASLKLAKAIRNTRRRINRSGGTATFWPRVLRSVWLPCGFRTWGVVSRAGWVGKC